MAIWRKLIKSTESYIDKDVPTGTTQQKYQSNVIKILLQVRTKTGHDFSNYKQNTIRRRIERRMAVHQIDRISTYLDYVRKNHMEVEALYKDLLIGVTNFFRDPDAFSILEKEVISEILKIKKDTNIRIWVPGCATGEEAYSIAIIIAELIENSQKHFNVQVFGTDIDEDAIEFARAAVYPDNIAADVSKERLKRFFIKEENTYKVKKRIREMLVFATQSLIKDPPFSKLDLVSCRNVLIYMDSVLQKKLLPIFHYTLNQNGFLFLGTSETIGKFTDLFSTKNAKWKIYQRLGVKSEKMLQYPIVRNLEVVSEKQIGEHEKYQRETNIYQLAEREILNKYAPPFVLVNEKHEVLYINGKIHNYLLTPTGVPVFDILKMAHEDLRYKLTTSLHKQAKKKEISVTRGLKVRNNGGFLTVDLTVKPLSVAGGSEDLTMVIFEEKEPPGEISRNKKTTSKTKKEDPRVTNLKQELKSAKEYLQATIEELETSNEELKSTNEEMQSTNEELQSTNEELETSKEEQQSTNEELETVNSELQNKVNELSRSNNDLSNLLGSTEIATIFLDTKLRIVRFTPSLSRLFNVLPSDLNRPIADITSKFNSETLFKDAEEVLSTLIQSESEIETKDGKLFNMRILPYRTIENMIEGVVITFVEITVLKQSLQALEESEERYRAIFDQAVDSVVVVNGDTGTLLDFNESACQNLGYNRKEFAKLSISDFEAIKSPSEVERHLKKILDKGGDTFETKHRTKQGEIRDILVSAKVLSLQENNIFVSIWRDITDNKRVQQEKDAIAVEWERTFDAVPDLISILDKDFKILRANKAYAEFFEENPKSLIGKYCFEVIHGTNEALQDCPHIKALKTRKPVEIDFFEPRLKVHFKGTASPFFDDAGEAIGTVYIIGNPAKQVQQK